MLTLSQRPVTGTSNQISRVVFSSVQSMFSGIGGMIKNTWNSVSELRKVRKELIAAQDRLADLEKFSSDNEELRLQNIELRKQLDFSRSVPFEHIAAEIIARNPGNLFTSLTINRGSHHGIEIGFPVVAFQDGVQALVGRVVKVSPMTSQIEPITARSSFVAVRLQLNRYDGLIEGRGVHTNGLILKYISKEARESINYGDLIISSGLGEVFPAGLLLGRVREVRAESYENTVEIIVDPEFRICYTVQNKHQVLIAGRQVHF